MSENEVYRIKITADITITKEKVDPNHNEASKKADSKPRYRENVILPYEAPLIFDDEDPIEQLDKYLERHIITKEQYDKYKAMYIIEENT